MDAMRETLPQRYNKHLKLSHQGESPDAVKTRELELELSSSEVIAFVLEQRTVFTYDTFGSGACQCDVGFSVEHILPARLYTSWDNNERKEQFYTRRNCRC